MLCRSNDITIHSNEASRKEAEKYYIFNKITMYFEKNNETVEVNLKTGEFKHSAGLEFISKKLKETKLTMDKIAFVESKGYQHIG